MAFEEEIRGDPEKMFQIKLGILVMLGGSAFLSCGIGYGLFCLFTGRLKKG